MSRFAFDNGVGVLGVIYNYDTTIFTFFKDFSTLLDRKIILLPRPGSRLGKHLDKQKFYLRRQKIYGSFLIFPKTRTIPMLMILQLPTNTCQQ